MAQGATADRGSAGAEGVVTKHSPRSVADTVARLRDLTAAQGMKTFAVIDHSGEAQDRGLELRDTKVVIFGSPEAGTPVMVSAPLVALDLPLKILVWSDGDRTMVSYTAPSVPGGSLSPPRRARRQAGRHRRADRRPGGAVSGVC